MADNQTYRKRCGCGFVTNEYGNEEAAKAALEIHQRSCSKGKK